MIVDCHMNLTTEPDHGGKIAKEAKRLKIDKVFVLAGPPDIPMWGYQWAQNEHLIKEWRRYPETLVPFGFFWLGKDRPELLDQLHAEGVRGVKSTRPWVNYDDKSLYPVFERAEKLGMTWLFHTGTVVRMPCDKEQDVNCDRMRPVRLDTLARAFPKLNIIGAHLGNPWYDEAAMVLFWNHNVYYDLSGTLLKRKNARWFNETLWWNRSIMKKLAPKKDIAWFPNKEEKDHPLDRVMFGTDVSIPEMELALREHLHILKALKVPKKVKDRVMGGNAQKLLNL